MMKKYANKSGTTTAPSSSARDDIELDYYYGDISKSEVHDLLIGKPDGSFIVRNASKPGNYTLTLKNGGTNVLLKIFKFVGRFGFSDGNTFGSLKDLIDYHKVNSLKSEFPTLNVTLLYPVTPDSGFISVRDATQASQAASQATQLALDICGNDYVIKTTVLLVRVEDFINNVTIELLYQVFSKFGKVLKIIFFDEDNALQALVQFGDFVTANAAKRSLDGQNIYSGCCKLRIYYSKLRQLDVHYNNDKSRDFTNPSLPTGNPGLVQNMAFGGEDLKMDGISHQYDIPLSLIEYSYIRQCTNVNVLEKIHKILTSHEEGYFPDLEKCCEEQILENWNNRLLRKETPIFTKRNMDLDERQQNNEFVQVKSSKQSSQSNNRVKPTDNRNLDKFDVNKELEKVDEDNKETKKRTLVGNKDVKHLEDTVYVRLTEAEKLIMELKQKVEQLVKTITNHEQQIKQLRDNQALNRGSPIEDFQFERHRETKRQIETLQKENKQLKRIKLAEGSRVAEISELPLNLNDETTLEIDHLSEDILHLQADDVYLKKDTKNLDDKDTCTIELEELYATLGIDVTLECGIDLFPAFFNSCAVIHDIIKGGKSALDHQAFDQLDFKVMHAKGVTIYTTTSLLTYLAEAQPEMTKGADYSLKKHTSGYPFVVIVKREMESTLTKWIVDPQKNVNMMCVLLLGTLEDDTYIPPMRNIFIKYATVSNILTTTDDILERASFSVLNGFVKRCTTLCDILDQMTDTEKETLLSIYASARNAYARSEVPTCERPSIPETIYQYPDHINSVIADLLQITGVIGCSTTCGKIEVCIESKVFPDVQAKVQEITNANYINVKCVSCTFTKYFSAGDKIEVNTKFGTLGGFAHRIPKITMGTEINQRRLAAVTAKHMTAACGHGRMNLVVGGQIIGHTDLTDLKHDFDVLPIDVYQRYEKNCDTRFKTEKGKYMYGVLISDELRQSLPNMPVFLWGANSSPGLGKIENIMDMSDGIYITIRDRNEGCLFSKPGDSGAIVCGTDLRERTLYVIAVLSGDLVGSSQTRYVAVLLKESFERLGNIYASDFKLCIDES